MLLHGRDVSANPEEVRSGARATKRAGYLLLALDHADVAFRPVVSEGHSEVVQEAERGILGAVATARSDCAPWSFSADRAAASAVLRVT